MRHHPSSPLSRLTDLLHRAYTRLFGERRANPAARHHYRARPAGAARMILAGGLAAKLRAEHDGRAMLRQARAELRAETQRMADLLSGIRRGRADMTMIRKVIPHVPVRARQRFTAAAGHVRTAARDGAAVAARTARQVGARHRHVPGSTDVQHDLAARILAYAKSYERARAAGERSVWQQGRTRLA